MNKNSRTVISDAKNSIVDEAARKVADAAVAEQIARRAYNRVLTVDSHEEGFDARVKLTEAQNAAIVEVSKAVREYRALTEPPAPDPCKWKFNEPELPTISSEPCDLGHDNPNMRQQEQDGALCKQQPQE